MKPLLVAVTTLLAAALASAAVAPPAEATFPGRNGTIVYRMSGGKDYTSSVLGSFDPRKKKTRVIVSCSLVYSSRGCYLASGSLSRDGRKVVIPFVRRFRETVLSDELATIPIFGGPWGSIRIENAQDALWSPDGSRLLITRYDPGRRPDLYLH